MAPPGMRTTRAGLPMQRLGTDMASPCALTSIVAGTLATRTTSPIASSRARRLPTGSSASFSSLNSAAGGSPVVSFGSELQPSSILAMISSMSPQPSKSPW